MRHGKIRVVNSVPTGTRRAKADKAPGDMTYTAQESRANRSKGQGARVDLAADEAYQAGGVTLRKSDYS